MKTMAVTLAMSAMIILGTAMVASAEPPQKTTLSFKGAGARASGLVFDDCLVYNFSFEGSEVMSKEGGSSPNQEAGVFVGLTIFDDCAQTVILSGSQFVQGEDLDFTANAKGAETLVTFAADGYEVVFAATWTATGPLLSSKINEKTKFGSTFIHQIRTGTSQAATVSGTIQVDELGLATEFDGAFGEVTTSSSGLLIITHQ